MSGIQVSQGQERFIVPLQGYTDDESTNKLEYITGQNTGGRKRAMDTVVYGTFPVSTANLIAAGSTSRIIRKVAHGARKNDIVQFTSGNNSGIAIQVLNCPTADLMILASTPEFTSAVGDTFDIKRYVSPQYASDGSLSVVATQGPTKFNKNATAVTVDEDTVDPTNNVLFPVKLIKNIESNLFYDYSSGAVDNTAYVQLVAATVKKSTSLTLFDSGGYAMVIGLGGAGVETPLIYVPPGGFNGEIPVEIPAGSRVSIKCLQVQSVAVGLIVANFIG